MIDMASVYAERFKGNPRMLQAAVMGQSPDPKLDPYTALNALRLIKESSMMAMAGKAQQPTSQPSILAETLAPPAPPQGLAGMMPMGAPAGQMPQQRPMPQPQQAPVQQASGGLAGMPLPDHDYAGGGIVAFSGEDGEQLVQGLAVPPGTPYDSNETGVYADGIPVDDSAGDPNAQTQFNRMLMQQIANMRKRDSRVTTPEDAARREDEYYQRELRRAGPDVYAPELARAEEYEADRRKGRNSGEAMALLTAAGKVLKGHSLAMGASEALPAFAQQMGEVERADAAAKTANAKMNFALKDAQRKERMGASRAAQASMENYRKFQQDENKAEFDRDNALAQLAARGVAANRPTGKGAGAGGPKLNELAFQANVDNLKETTKPKPGESDKAFDARIRAMAADLTTKQTKTSYSTGEFGGNRLGSLADQLTGAQNRLLSKEMADWEDSTDAKKARKLGNFDEAYDEQYKRKAKELMSGISGSGKKAPTAGTNTRIKLDANGNILP